MPTEMTPALVRLARVTGCALAGLVLTTALALLGLVHHADAKPAAPAPLPTTTSTTSTTSTTASTSTTSTTVPASEPTPDLAPASAPTPSSSRSVSPAPTDASPVDEAPRLSRCDSALDDVEASGLTLPAGFDFYCPGPAIDQDGRYRTGLFSWSNVCQPGDHTPGIGCFIDVDEPGIRSDVYLRNVIAHELCHARQTDAERNGEWTEAHLEADAVACTAAYGFGATR